MHRKNHWCARSLQLRDDGVISMKEDKIRAFMDSAQRFLENLERGLEEADQSGATIKASWGVKVGGAPRGESPETESNVRGPEPEPLGVKVTASRMAEAEVFDEGDYISVVVEMPGIRLEEVRVELTGDIVHIDAATPLRTYTTEALLPRTATSVSGVTGEHGIFEIRLVPGDA